MDKNNIKDPKILIGIATIFIGVLIGSLIRTNVEVYAPVTNKSIEQMKDEIRVLNDEIIQLDEVIDEKEEEYSGIIDIIESGNTKPDTLLEEFESKKIKAGHTKLNGPGIKIRMYDNIDTDVIGYNVNDDVIHDIDILNILNDLKVAGAEAISINEERVLSVSEIKCGGPIIRINENSIGTPFTIKAIGNPKQLMASVNAPATYGDTLKNVYKIGFEAEIDNDILIPEYNGDFNFKYAKPKEGDN